MSYCGEVTGTGLSFRQFFWNVWDGQNAYKTWETGYDLLCADNVAHWKGGHLYG